MTLAQLILITAVTIGVIGLVCGIILSVSAKFLAVHEDPRIGEIDELLPGANCGGCGYAGCADYAKAIIIDGAAINLCAPGGADTLEALGKCTGQEAVAGEKMVAVVMCGGDNTKAPRKFQYNGIIDCAAAAAVGGGDKICSYGCLGYGSCLRVCPVSAIELVNDIAVVHPELCISCGACVSACPRDIISMVPATASIHVLCNSKDKGPVVKKACEVGCIGCRMCVKLGGETFVMDGFLASRDYSIEVADEVIVEKCPGKCIVNTKEPQTSGESA